MRWFSVLFFLLLVCLSFAQSRAYAKTQQVPLTSVALIADLDAPSDPDDPGTGGGFDMGAYFQTRLADAHDIQMCVDPVERAAADWASKLGLAMALRDRTATSLTLHYAKAGMSGFFSMTYRVDEKVKARARVDYIELNGTERTPEFARDLIGTFQIAALEDSLDAAIKCGGKAS